MKNVDYIFNLKAVKMLDTELLLAIWFCFERLEKDCLAKAENKTDEMFIRFYLKELNDEICKQIVERKIFSFE